MKPYQPSNKVPSSGFTWMLLSAIAGGVVIGGITWAISNLIYLLILFPIGMGFAGGAANSFGVRQGKVRNPLIAGAVGVFTGLVIYATFFGGDYLKFKQAASEEITKAAGQEIDSATKEKLIDTFLAEKTQSTGILGFVKYSAQQGVNIGKVGTKGFTLNEPLTWIYWLIELGIISGISGAIAYGSAKDPFCEGCDRWYDNKKRVGNVDENLSQRFLELVNQDNLPRAGEQVDPAANIVVNSLEVHLQECPNCPTGDAILTIDRASTNSNGNLELKQVLQGTISRHQQSQFLQAANTPKNTKTDGDSGS